MNSILSKRIYFNIILSVIFSYTVSIIDLKSQPISTVGEIYDYDIGDIFHYDIGFTTGVWGGTTIYRNVEILDKYFLQNNTILCYRRDVAEQEKYSEDTFWTYSYYIDSVCYSNLDSLICDSANTSIDSSWYNGRLMNDYFLNYGWEDYTYTWVVGCGQAYYKYWYYSGSKYRESLIYYKKGFEVWGTSVIVSTKNELVDDRFIEVYPNPAKDYVNINSEIETDILIEIYSITGANIKCLKLSKGTTNIDISDLAKGMYLIKIKSNSSQIYKKLIKE